MHFNKPFILVTRVGNNNTNDTYRNPRQLYYEFDDMSDLFHYAAARISGNETPVSALRITVGQLDTDTSYDDSKVYRMPTHGEYFHNFPVALDEYKRGIRVDM